MSELLESNRTTMTSHDNEACQTPKNIEAPLSPVLSSSKRNRKHISRLKSQIRCRQSQNVASQSTVNSPDCYTCDEILSTENRAVDVISTIQTAEIDNLSNCESTAVTSGIFKVPQSPILQTVHKESQSSPNELLNSNLHFSTGSGKCITLNDGALQSALKVFNDITIDTSQPKGENKQSLKRSAEDYVKTKKSVKVLKKIQDDSSKFNDISDTQMCSVIDNVECLIDLMSCDETLTQFHSVEQSEKNSNTSNLTDNKSSDCSVNDYNLCTQETDMYFSNLTLCNDGSLGLKDKNCNLQTCEKERMKKSIEDSSFNDNFRGFDHLVNSSFVSSLYKRILKSVNDSLKNNISYPLTLKFDEIKSQTLDETSSEENLTQDYTLALNAISDQTDDSIHDYSLETIDAKPVRHSLHNTNNKSPLVPDKKNLDYCFKSTRHKKSDKRETENELLPENFTSDPPSNLEMSNSHCGFSTASGKTVDISEKSLIKAKNLFEEFECSQLSDNNCAERKIVCKDKFDTPTINFGFSTASGKAVNVSEKSLGKAKNIFEELELTEPEVNTNKEQTPFSKSEFSAASGSKVNISEKASAKANNLFAELDFSEPMEHSGFSTASGMKVKISEKSLVKAKIIFEELELTEPKVNINKEQTPFSKSGFSTASGSKVNVSEKALAKANNLFAELDFSERMDYSGFSTAVETKVKVSEKSMAKAKNVFQELDVLQPTENINLLQTPTSNLEFSTASGKKVNISDKSLAKAKILFEELEGLQSPQTTSAEQTPNSNLGFSTASGKSVSISKNSLMKAKNLLEEFNLSQDEANNFSKDKLLPQSGNTNMETPKQNETTTNTRYSTTLENGVKSLKHTRNLFNNIEFSEMADNNSTPNQNVGFSMASGKKVNITEKSMKKARNLFNEFEFSQENSSPSLLKNAKNLQNENSLHFPTLKGNVLEDISNIDTRTESISDILKDCEEDFKIGFSTTSENLVSTSEESLETASKLMNDSALEKYVNRTTKYSSLLDTKFDPNKSKSFGSNCGFNTASGQNVKISNESIDKAKLLFSEVESTNCTTPNVKNHVSSTASGNKVVINEEVITNVKKIFANCDNSNLSTPDRTNVNIRKQTPTVNTHSGIKNKFIIKQTTYTSPIVDSSPSCNNSTPVLKNLSSSRKRSLGMSSCKLIEIPDNKLKRAKLIFDEDNSNKDHKITKVNAGDTILMPKSINFVRNETPLNVSVASSSMTQGVENCTSANNQSLIIYQNPTAGDNRKWKSDLQRDYDMLKLKMNILETKMSMLDEQDTKLKAEHHEHKRQQPGHLFVAKRSKHRISLKDAVSNRKPCKMTYNQAISHGVPSYLLELTPENAEKLHFYVPWKSSTKAYPAILRTPDDAVVIPNRNNHVGLSEIEAAFKTMPGVDLSLVPNRWVANHFRWIVWKLASLERNFPDVFENYLSVDNVMSQLKYRYDREIDRVERSALKKILEGDDTPGRRLVLCIASIINISNGKYELELTDGWYSVQTQLDDAFNSLVGRGVIKVGYKIITHGAELLNCEGCPPLEIPSSVRLQIHFNSTRRAPWDARLGYQCNPGPFFISLRSIYQNGGQIGALKLYIARIYPLGFMEKLENGIQWRNKKAEEHRMMEWESQQQDVMEKLQHKILNELSDEWALKKKKSIKNAVKQDKIKQISCAQTLYEMFESSNDPESFKELLTEQQYASLQNFQREIHMQREADLSFRMQQLTKEKLVKRNVSSVLKMLIVDFDSIFHNRIINIWRPTESHLQQLKEGHVVLAYNLIARNNNALSTVARSKIDIDYNAEVIKFTRLERSATPIFRFLDPSYKPLFGEFDTVGVVVHTAVHGNSQTVWISDECMRLLFIKIRDSPENCNLLENLMVGKIVAALNLIHRKPSKNFAEAVANNYTVFSCFPQHEHVQNYMEEFQQALPDDFTTFLEECIARVDCYNDEMLKKFNYLNPFTVNVDTPSSLNHMACSELTLSDEELCHLDTTDINL